MSFLSLRHNVHCIQIFKLHFVSNNVLLYHDTSEEYIDMSTHCVLVLYHVCLCQISTQSLPLRMTCPPSIQKNYCYSNMPVANGVTFSRQPTVMSFRVGLISRSRTFQSRVKMCLLVILEHSVGCCCCELTMLLIEFE